MILRSAIKWWICDAMEVTTGDPLAGTDPIMAGDQ